MLEVAVRAKVQRFQACVGDQLKQPLPAQADRVPGQAESTAGLQLPSPDWKCIADQAGCGTVPLPAGTAYVGLAAMHHAVRGVCQHRIKSALAEQRRRLPSVAGEDCKYNGPIPADRGSPRHPDACR